MAVFCPISKNMTIYLTCQECEYRGTECKMMRNQLKQEKKENSSPKSSASN
jgi:hypothetical protein